MAPVTSSSPAAAPPVDAAKGISPQTWKTVIALTVAGVVIGAGAWYVLSKPSEIPKPRRPSGGAKRKSKTKRAEKPAEPQDTIPSVGMLIIHTARYWTDRRAYR